jgi:putative polyketide hydroxylase
MKAPVLIVGGGPVGTFSALLLAKYGVRSIVFERRENINPHPKSRSVSRRTMEVMRGLGITDEDFEPISLPASWTHCLVYTTTLTGTEIGRVRCPDFESLPVTDSPCVPHMSSQEKHEKLLRDLADKSNLIEFRMSSTVKGITQSAHACTLSVESDRGAVDSVEGEYVLFADGARSQAREWLGIRMQGQHEIATVLDVHFDVDGLTEQVAERIAPLLFVRCDAGFGVYQPIDGKSEWRCQIMGIEHSLSADDAASWIRATAGDNTLDVRVRSVRPWTMHSIMADRFQADRAFLLGDAAHVLPPTGGLGLNSGFQAVHNLMWKLAGVINGWAEPNLLATYDVERREITQINAEASFKNNVNAGAIGEAYRTNGDVRGALSRAESYGRFAGLDLGVRYTRGAFVSDGTQATPLQETIGIYDGAATPGCRAPHVWLFRNGEKISSLDLFNNGFCLLAGTDGDAWVKVARELCDEYHIPLSAFAVNHPQCPITGKDWTNHYAIGEAGAVLVRPDGHIGFRQPGDAENRRETLANALAACIGRRAL